MASAHDVISDWTADLGERHSLFGTTKGLVLRWLNEAQLRFVDKSECLRAIWEPDIDSTGEIPLPKDFLREFRDQVYWDSSTALMRGDYPSLVISAPTTTDYYAIYADKFYVFAAASGSPKIYYLRKPTLVTVGNYESKELDIPSEYHHQLILFLDAMYTRRRGDVGGYIKLLQEFDQRATEAGVKYSERRDSYAVMRGGIL